MSEQPNPYAPPRQESDYFPLQTGQGGGLRREGNLVVCSSRGTVFPPRCVICNEPAPHRLRRKLYWHPPGYYAIICIGALFYVIVALIVRKTAELELGLCTAHSARRRNGILLGWIGVPVCLVGGVVLADIAPELMLLGWLAGFGCLIAAVLMVRLIQPRRIDETTAWLKVGKPFLESLGP